MMKRIVAFLLSMLLLVPIASADTDKEIVFHGIPWGIGLDELSTQLKQRDIPTNGIETGADMHFWDYQFLSVTEDHVDSTGFYMYFVDYDDTVKIAGYPVRSMYFYSHYGVTDGKISLDANDSEYYLVNISFAASDEMVAGIYSDILNKLTKLYGSSTESAPGRYTQAVWYGANDTAVMLYRSSGEYQYVCLIYGKTVSKQELLELRRLVIEYEIQSVEDDLTGL